MFDIPLHQDKPAAAFSPFFSNLTTGSSLSCTGEYPNPKMKKTFLLMAVLVAATYNYQLNPDKGTLIISLPDDASQHFEVGINSVGNFALLLKSKEKKER
jgi:hypothetical protein